MEKENQSWAGLLSLSDFKKKVRNASRPRIHKIRNSIGVYSGYKYYRKNKPDDKKYVLSESQYFAIIRQINNLLVDDIVIGIEVKLPHRMGTIEVRKYEKSLKIDENGNVKTNLPIDWDSTLKLWYEDEESYKNKTLLRLDEHEIYKVLYNKENANFNNRSFYEFVFNKDLKLRLKHNIKQGIIDAFLIGRRNRYVE